MNKTSIFSAAFLLTLITFDGAGAAKNVADLFAYPDEVAIANAVVSISAGSYTFTCSAHCTFTSGDETKMITVSGAGAGGGTLVTTIDHFISSTSLTLHDPASTTLTSQTEVVEYGTDAAAKIQTYLNGFQNFAGPGPALYWPGPGTYLVHGLVLPKGPVAFYCDSPGSTTLKLPNGTNSYMWADESYVGSLTTNDAVFQVENCKIDGNATYQSTASPLLIHRRAVRYRFNDIVNSSGAAMFFPSLGLDGSTCISSMGNPRIRENLFASNAGQALYFLDGTCNAVSDAHIQGNTFDGNTTTCDLTLKNYQIYTDRASGFTITGTNRFFDATGCGDIHLGGSTASVLIEDNTFDANANTVNGASPIREVFVETGGTNTFSGPTIVGNVFKYTNPSLNGSATELRFVEISNTSGALAMQVNSNTFFSTQLSGVTTIKYSGSHLGNVRLNAQNNAYMSNALAPTDPNINTGSTLALVAVASLPTCSSSFEGKMIGVNDASSPTYNSTLTGGSSTHVIAYCNGSGWVAH